MGASPESEQVNKQHPEELHPCWTILYHTIYAQYQLLVPKQKVEVEIMNDFADLNRSVQFKDS